MDEAERLCDRIAIIVGGKLAACGTPAELLAQTGEATLEEAFVVLAGRDSLGRSEDQPPEDGP
jgi:ABC-type multidrug transport system ATPase subunit